MPDRAGLIETLEERLGMRVVGHGTIPSTMAAAATDFGPAPALHLARAQTAGRGRHGRVWESPAGNLYATIRWPEEGRPFPPGILAAVQLAWARAVRDAAGPPTRCKWPNDGLLDDAKWSGLIAVRPADRSGELHLGLGANLVAAPPAITNPPAAHLHGRWPDWPGDEAVAGMLLAAAVEVLRDGPDSVPPRLAEWPRYDAIRLGEPVTVEAAGRTCEALYRGVDSDGCLCVEERNEMRRFASGEVTRLRVI